MKMKKIGIRWILSYLIILLIPLAAICINHFYSARIIGKEIYQSNKLIVENLGNGVDECLKEAYVLHSNLYLEESLRNLRSYTEKNNQFYYDAMIAKNRFSTYDNDHSDVSALIYFPEFKYIFDMKAGNEVKSYYNTYRMGKTDICGFDEWIEKISGNYRGEMFVGNYFHPSTGEACVVYANSMQGNEYQPVNIFVSIPLSSISGMLGNIYDDSHFMMLAENDIVAAWSNGGEVRVSEELKEAYSLAEEQGAKKGYYLVKVSSDFDSKVSYCMMISRQSYEEKERHLRAVFCITLVVALLVAFKVLDILFKQMNEKKLLHERLRTQEELMQSNYLLMLMKGRKVERYKNVIQITNGRKLVLVGIMIPFPEKKHNQQDEILIFTVDNIFSELVKDEKYYKIDDGQYLFYLFEVDENEGAWRKEALKKAEYLNQIMNAWWKQGLYIAVGKFEDKLEDISASYQDIMDEFRDRKLIGEAVVTDIQKKQKILSANQKLVERIREIIEEQYEDSNLNVTGIAQELGKTAKHISEVFKEETGESILYAINYKRITKAQALMRTGKYKLAEIPEMTGYSNMNTFRRNFQQIVGISPGKYMDNKEEQE